MALTLLRQPQQWSAVYLPMKYEYSFVLDISGLSPTFFQGGTANYQGKLAVLDPNRFLPIGGRYFVALFGSSSLYQELPITISRRVLINNQECAVTTLPYNSGISEVNLYSFEKVQSLYPVFSLYVQDNFVKYIKGVPKPNNSIQVDISSDVAPFVKSLFPVLGSTDNNLFTRYRIDYQEGVNSFRGKDMFALYASIQPSNPPCSVVNEEWEASGWQCLNNGTTNERAATLLQKINGAYTGVSKPNINSDPDYVADRANAEGCPIPDPKASFNLYDPIWQNGNGQVSIADIGGGNPSDGVFMLKLNGGAFQPLTNYGQVGPNAYAIAGLTNGINTIVLRRGSNVASELSKQTTVVDPAGHSLSVSALMDAGGVNPRVQLTRRYLGAPESSTEVLTLSYDIMRYDVYTKVKTVYKSGTASITSGQSTNIVPVAGNIPTNLQYEYFLQSKSISLSYYALPQETKFIKQGGL